MEIQELEAEGGGKIPVNIYDLEPNLRRGVHLPRHNRFYQAKIDARHLKSGEEDYEKAKELLKTMEDSGKTNNPGDQNK